MPDGIQKKFSFIHRKTWIKIVYCRSSYVQFNSIVSTQNTSYRQISISLSNHQYRNYVPRKSLSNVRCAIVRIMKTKKTSFESIFLPNEFLAARLNRIKIIYQECQYLKKLIALISTFQNLYIPFHRILIMT